MQVHTTIVNIHTYIKYIYITAMHSLLVLKDGNGLLKFHYIKNRP